MPPAPLKPVVWVGDSLRMLESFPAAVQDEVEFALVLAQRGVKHIAVKPLKGFGAGLRRQLRITAVTRSAPSTPCARRIASTFDTRSRRSRSMASQGLRRRSS